MSGEIDAKIDKATGRVKQAAGDLTDNDRLKREGKLEEAAGDVKDKAAAASKKAAQKVSDAVDDVKDAVKDRGK